MTLQLFLALAFNAALLTVCGFALCRGGRPERIGAAINLIASSVTTALRLVNPCYFAPTQIVMIFIDLGASLSFFWLGVATIRFWPIWAAAFGLASLFMTFCGALLPEISLFAYHTGLGIYAYLALGALALGTLRIPCDAGLHLRNGSRRLWNQDQRTKT